MFKDRKSFLENEITDRDMSFFLKGYKYVGKKKGENIDAKIFEEIREAIKERTSELKKGSEKIDKFDKKKVLRQVWEGSETFFYHGAPLKYLEGILSKGVLSGQMFKSTTGDQTFFHVDFFKFKKSLKEISRKNISIFGTMNPLARPFIGIDVIIVCEIPKEEKFKKYFCNKEIFERSSELNIHEIKDEEERKSILIKKSIYEFPYKNHEVIFLGLERKFIRAVIVSNLLSEGTIFTNRSRNKVENIEELMGKPMNAGVIRGFSKIPTFEFLKKKCINAGVVFITTAQKDEQFEFYGYYLDERGREKTFEKTPP